MSDVNKNIMHKLKLWHEILDYFTNLKGHAYYASPQAVDLALQDNHLHALDSAKEHSHLFTIMDIPFDEDHVFAQGLTHWYRHEMEQYHAQDNSREGQPELYNTLSFFKLEIEAHMRQELKGMKCTSDEQSQTVANLEARMEWRGSGTVA